MEKSVKRERNDGVEGQKGAAKRPRTRSNRAPLAPGDARQCGCVLLSCYKAKESQATREAMAMLGDLCEELYAAPQEAAAAAGDVLGDLAAEAAAFRQGTGGTAAWFRPVRIKNNCMGVIAVNPAHPQAQQVDVLHLVDLAFRRMVAAGQGNTRKVLRMWPLPTPLFPLALPVVRLAAQQLDALIARTLADGSLPSERPVRVAISFKARSVAAPSADKLHLLTAMPPPDAQSSSAGATGTVQSTCADTLAVPKSTPAPAAGAADAPAAGAADAPAAGAAGAPAAGAADAPAAGAADAPAAGAADKAADAVTESTLMTRDVVTPLMCAEVKRIMGAHGVPFQLVYKAEHVTVELQALQSIAGAYAVLTHEHEKAARFNMQKLPASSAKASASQAAAAPADSSSTAGADVTAADK